MAKWFIILVLAFVVATTSARNVPNNDDHATTVEDQKSFLNYGGYSGDNGFPFGGVGGGDGDDDSNGDGVGLGGGGLAGGGPGFGGLPGNGVGGVIGGADGGLGGDDDGDASGVPLPP